MALDDAFIQRLEDVFPHYLTATDKKLLSDRIGSYPSDRHYFSSSWEGPSEPIQGDGWNSFTKLDFYASTKKKIAGIVISNSCDINESNKSLRNRNIVFAPITKLETYENRLRSNSEIPSSKVDVHLDAIRKQNKTEVFYLPESKETPETIVQFDDIAAEPLGSFSKSEDRRKLFRLNNYGFYIFLMKLSIHFTRFGEKINRSD